MPPVVRFGSDGIRAEIFFDGQWGTVCDDNFDVQDAIVFCRSLGCVGGNVISSATTEDGTLPILADDLSCTGIEINVLDCSGMWGAHNCDHTEDVGVSCSCPGESQLSAQTTSSQLSSIVVPTVRFGTDGIRAEVYYQNQWGTICDDYFDLGDAMVFCRSLGCIGGTVVPCTETVDGTLPILLDDLSCIGSEANILECSGMWGSHNCNHREDVGVSCSCPTV